MMILSRATARSEVVIVTIFLPINQRLIEGGKFGEVHGSRLVCTTKLSPDDQKALMKWPYVNGIPIFPADSINKHINLNGWPTLDFTKVDFRAEMFKGIYDNGAAARMGRTLKTSGLYSVALDFDGWDAVVAWFGSWERVLALAKKTLVEWHQDKGKIHVLLFTKEPLQNKKIHVGPNNVLLEVRCQKQAIFISPSPHKDGNKYCPLGVDKIETLDDTGLMKLKGQISLLSDKYMSDEDKAKYDAWLDDPNTILGAGAGRHDATKFKVCSYYNKYSGEWLDLTDEQRFERAWQWHLAHCKPARSRQEFDAICKWVVENHREKRDTEHNQIRERLQYQQKHDNLDYPGVLMKDYTLKTLRDTEEIWYYDEKRGIFVPGAETMLAARIEDDLGGPQMNEKGEFEDSTLTTHQVNEYIDHIRRRTYIDRDEFNPSTEWLACKNCMVNLITGEIRPSSPDFMCTTQIPIDYNHDYPAGVYADFFRMVEGKEELPRILSFPYEIMDLKDVELFLDYLAYCLWREYRYNFWMLLVGKGFNGKSVLLDLIERFFGIENKSGETLHRLLNERFSVANLFNKMVNVDADVSPDVIFNNTGILKKLTGNDLHVGEHKFKKPFYFRNHAKLFFSCNKIPETDDDTDAFFRRIFIINFTRQFFGEQEDPHLIDKISTGDQLSILLSELLARLPRIIKCGLRKVTNEALEEAYDKFTRGSDPVKYFYEKALAPEAGNKIPKLDMYDYYHEFCKLHRLTPESDQSFSRKLTKDYHLSIRQYRINGERIRCWVDVRKVDWQEVETKAQMNLEEIQVGLTNQQKEELK